jgi:hypothetical protein
VGRLFCGTAPLGTFSYGLVKLLKNVPGAPETGKPLEEGFLKSVRNVDHGRLAIDDQSKSRWNSFP